MGIAAGLGSMESADDIRVVAATHKNLDDLVKAGTFRADLQARLMGLTVHLPALRDRMEDLGLLVHALARRHFPKGACPPLSLAAARRLFACPFPFNIRELDRRVASVRYEMHSDPGAAGIVRAVLRLWRRRLLLRNA